MIGRQVLRTPEAADFLGLAVSTLEKMRAAGTGPRFVRLTARAVGYTVDDLNEWLATRREPLPADAGPAR